MKKLGFSPVNILSKPLIVIEIGGIGGWMGFDIERFVLLIVTD